MSKRRIRTRDVAGGGGGGASVRLRAVAPVHRAPSESEKRYRALIQASTSVVWRADPTGAIIEAWGWADFTGQAGDTYLGHGWLDALHPDDRERVQRHWGVAIRGGELPPVEYRVLTGGGLYRWAKSRGLALRDETGAVVEWVGTVTDIEERKNSEQALREREELLRLAVEATGLGIWDMELPSRNTEWSPQLKAMAGLAPDAVIDDDTFYSLVHPEDRDDVEEKIVEAVGSRDLVPYNVVYRLRRADSGEERWWHEWSRLVAGADGKPARLVGAIQDITERKQAELERLDSEKRWRLALRAGRMVAWERTVGSDHTARSENAEDLLGVGSGSDEGFIGHVDLRDQRRVQASMRAAASAHSTIEFRYHHPDGRDLWLETSAMPIEGDGGPRRIIGVTTDITERKASEERLRRAALTDALTGLDNRASLQMSLGRVIGQGRRNGTDATLVLVDIDHFKDINDTLGHDAGDRMLKVAADRLRNVAGDRASVARLGGDEFALLISGRDTEDLADQLAHALLDELRKPFTYRGKPLSMRASIGIASFPEHGGRSIELFKNADLALYAAKSGGRARVRHYTPDMREVVEQRLALVGEVKTALAAGEFSPFYQPKIDLATGRVVGFEALARWLHPKRGVVTPQVFGAVFEDGELSTAIGDAMLSQMIRDMRHWLTLGLPFGRLALNLSSFAFMARDLAETLIETLAEAEVPTSCFEIEVTETVLLDGEARGVAQTLRRLHEAGVKISLDDFGTGYASLTHLKRFPVDELKIDRSFVRDLEDDPEDAAIVSAVISLARSLDIKVVAEGVETEGQAAKLQSWGCHYGQGFLFAKPMTASRVPWFLRQERDKRPPQPIAPVRRRVL